ncbi:MAG: D-alanyl-D-alanine carboxypeptidase, partial [Lachnospiraceae bacterium]|nr:D-alanyl-D-alanine carboxypeptidase [Lachnospiraceae bacterium]
MKLISKRVPALLMVCLLGAASLDGCAAASSLENAFTADDPALGVLSGGEDSEVSYYAEDLCVTAEDVDELSVDTSESYGACFFRLDTAEVLYANNIHAQLYPASTTKIMTALLAIENGDLDASTTVSETAVTFTEDGVSTAGLKEGEVQTLRQLLYALLL